MNIYILRHIEVPWGDYGAMLLSGMTAHLPRKNGLLQLERPGPFVPPLSLTGINDIVVTDAFKKQLEGSGLSGFAFQPVIKARIVHLEWEKWDRTVEDPKEYPETGEPEDYILGRPHSPETAEQIGGLWELCLEEHAEVERVPRDPSEWGLVKWAPWDSSVDIYMVLSSWDGTDLFRAKTVGYTYASEGAKTWLEQTVPEWVSFELALTK
jgi:hypothetical protein